VKQKTAALAMASRRAKPNRKTGLKLFVRGTDKGISSPLEDEGRIFKLQHCCTQKTECKYLTDCSIKQLSSFIATCSQIQSFFFPFLHK
jgi:hypothetical protein